MDESQPRSFEHVPVLLGATLEAVDSVFQRASNPFWVMDCTVGGAGHSVAILERFSSARLVALDRDPHAVAVARERLAPFGNRAEVVRARFSEIDDVLAVRDRPGVDVILADIGVSSHQLDTGERGFSFLHDGPLDMRMSSDAGAPAWEVIESTSQEDLARAIRAFGEERRAKAVARAVKAASPRTTLELARAVRRVVPKARDGIDPATRTFQALRILVNGELDELDALLAALPRALNDRGVAAIISFHSLEDRKVKRAFRTAVMPCVCPPTLPVCSCGRVPSMEVLTPKPVTADDAEKRKNPRARSAKLRVARRLPRVREVTP